MAMIDYILDSTDAQKWLSKSMDKSWNYPRYASADIAAGVLASFNLLPTPPAGTPANLRMTNLDAGGVFAASPEQYLITSIQHSVTPNGVLSCGVLADATLIGDSLRLIKETYFINIVTGQNVQILGVPASRVPEGPGMMGQISTGGCFTWGWPDEANVFNLVYPVPVNGVVRVNFAAEGVNVAGVLPTTTATMRSTLWFNGVRYRTDIK